VRRSQRPTQQDIARAAGVSTAVVSLVINGRADGKVKISKRTQERVWAAIREHGYMPNLAARQLAGGRTNIIGVFTYEPIFPMEPNNFYQPFLVGIEEQAAVLDYNLLLFTRLSPDGGRHIYHDGVNQLQTTDGAILLGTNEDRAELARLYQDGFPFVFVGRRELDAGPIAYTAAGYADATEHLIRKLLEQGHRRILYVGQPLINESAQDREAGFRRAMAGAGIDDLDELIIRCQIHDLGGGFLRGWIERGVTAFAMEHMAAALRILEVSSEEGYGIPEAFSLVALGKADDPTVDHRGIDTFFIPHREMGAQALVLLCRILEDPDADVPRQITIPCTPAAGRTTGPPPGSRVARKEVR